ncbi:MAG: AAA family ATPase [Marmoricola sp.]
MVAEVGRQVVAVVGEKRSTWRHWNLWAEASRQTMEWRFATPRDREAAVALIVDAATGASIRLTPPELAMSPGAFRWSDGSSRFRPRQSAVFSSADLLAAEDRLLVRANTATAPAVDLATVEDATRRDVLGHHLSEGQANALAQIATSRRQVDLLVGPAGAGKTTAMHALHTAWTTAHGPGSVVGLAPSAAAAQVLADDLGIVCENTAKWLHEHEHGRAQFTSGQLVVIDEATLAGTHTLDRITGLATDAGAKVLLVGDWAQLQSVDAGGAFSMLAAARDDTPELVEILRFDHDWEATATAALRVGDTDVIGTYLHHDRVNSGGTDEMTDAAYDAWRTDIRAGLSSVLVTEATATVTRLNQRARAERILTGETEAGREVELADGNHASVGDVIITRRNQRHLRSLRGGWVRNGDRWRITDVLPDGSVLATRLDQKTAGAVVLPAAYVRESVDLGYATTAHRAQGMTVDTAHVVASGRTNRENLYVSMTRGRRSNTVYVALDNPDDTHTPPQDGEVTARTVLYGILKRSGAELSAHQMIEAEHEHWSSIAQLAAEYETIAADAQHDRWTKLVHEIGLDDADVERLLVSDSFAPLTAEFRRAEANGHDLDTVLPRVVASRGLADAHDIGAVLISRLHHATARPKRTGRRRAEPDLDRRLDRGCFRTDDRRAASSARRAPRADGSPRHRTGRARHQGPRAMGRDQSVRLRAQAPCSRGATRSELSPPTGIATRSPALTRWGRCLRASRSVLTENALRPLSAGHRRWPATPSIIVSRGSSRPSSLADEFPQVLAIRGCPQGPENVAHGTRLLRYPGETTSARLKGRTP